MPPTHWLGGRMDPSPTCGVKQPQDHTRIVSLVVIPRRSLPHSIMSASPLSPLSSSFFILYLLCSLSHLTSRRLAGHAREVVHTANMDYALIVLDRIISDFVFDHATLNEMARITSSRGVNQVMLQTIKSAKPQPEPPQPQLAAAGAGAPLPRHFLDCDLDSVCFHGSFARG